MKNAGNFFDSFVRDTELCIMGMLDLDGRFVRCNRGLEKLIGASEADLEGRPITDHFRFEGYAATVAEGLAEWLMRREHLTTQCEASATGVSAFSARLFLSALRDSEGVQRGFGIIVENQTPRLRMESAILQSEDRFKKAFAAAPDGLVIATLRDSRVLEVNESWQAIFGYTREETIGKSSVLLRLMDPEVRERIIDRIMKDGRVRDMQIQIRNKSGQSRDIVFSTERLRLDGEECMMTILRDITDKRKTESELRNREKLYRTLASNFPNAIIVLYDMEYTILVAEGGILGLFGLTPEIIEGKNLRDVSPGGTFAGVEKYYRSALEGNPTFHESEFMDRYWAVDHVPVKAENGEVWAGLMVCRDVTELKQTIRNLEKSERSNRSLLEALPDSIFQFDVEGKCVDFRPGHGTQTEAWPRDAVAGKGMRDIFPKESAALLQVNHFKALKSGAAQVCEFSMTTEKETREMEARTVPFGRENILLLLRDITGSRNLERLAANITAREQRRLGGELHDGICQELTGISFLCKSLEAKLESQTPELVKSMAEISRLLGDAIGHTRALITGLYPAGLEHGLADAMRELVGKLGKVYPTSFSFIGEDQQLSQDVAAHLFFIAREAAGNAARHGHAGSIRIYLGSQEENLVLKVSDDGRGMPAVRKETEGRGMDIMRYRARLIGARLDLLSREGKGTTVTCILPVDLAYGFNPKEK